MTLFKRAKNLWKLSNLQIPDAMQEEVHTVNLPIPGDGKAVVMSDFTEDELAQYQHEQEQGWKHFYRKLRRWIG